MEELLQSLQEERVAGDKALDLVLAVKADLLDVLLKEGHESAARFALRALP